MASRAYFDNAATTPLAQSVREAMLPFLHSSWGNPSSLHAEGRAARTAVDEARAETAAYFGAAPAGVIFTASGTEADNLALRGVVDALDEGPIHVITSTIEHPAIRETCRSLARRSVGVTLLPVAESGIVDPNDLRRALRPDTRLVSVMAANNVLGTIQPIRELARITREHGALFHTDAVQAAGKLPINLERDGLDLVSLSAHKLNGPKGVGALLIRPGVRLNPISTGGGQEGARRSGTENVVGIVGFAAAVRLARTRGSAACARLVELRDTLIDGVLASEPRAYVIGDRYRRLPGHVCLGIAGLEGEAIKLMLALDAAGFAVSTGSACSAHHATEPSYVLTALGFDAFRARGGLRITLGFDNTADEVRRFIEVLPGILEELRPIAAGAAEKTYICRP